MLPTANNEDEVKRSGQQDGGVLNLRVPNMVASPDVEHIVPNWGISARMASIYRFY